ncbi:MAG TPA: fumarate hydratase C-terminal domain-containing protein, partial [Anaerolineae bacterium]|nr:fumarate hydratase C-terminal domain-containing protein [Anaerolineae bacterium]
APPGKVIGSIGPTTSARMDPYTPALLARGLKGMIGKGPRSPEVKSALIEHNAVYFAATGGVAALLSTYVKKAELIAYPELGPEAIYRLEVERFPVLVAIDVRGNDLYEKNRQIYRQL